jgi:hypothetical protein
MYVPLWTISLEKSLGMGFAVKYKTNYDFRCFIRKFLCLPFIPIYYILNVYKLIKESMSNENLMILVDFLAYFERTYMSVESGEKFNSLYGVKFWNAYDKVLLNINRKRVVWKDGT